MIDETDDEELQLFFHQTLDVDGYHERELVRRIPCPHGTVREEHDSFSRGKAFVGLHDEEGGRSIGVAVRIIADSNHRRLGRRWFGQLPLNPRMDDFASGAQYCLTASLPDLAPAANEGETRRVCHWTVTEFDRPTLLQQIPVDSHFHHHTSVLPVSASGFDLSRSSQPLSRMAFAASRWSHRLSRENFPQVQWDSFGSR